MVKRLRKSGEGVPVIAADAQQLIWILGGGPVSPRITDERVAENATRRLRKRSERWTFSRTLNMLRGRSRIIHAEEWIDLNEEAAEMAQQLKTLEGLQHENNRLAGRAIARAAAALVGEDRHPARDLGDEEVERSAEQGGARPDLLKRKYWAG